MNITLKMTEGENSNIRNISTPFISMNTSLSSIKTNNTERLRDKIIYNNKKKLTNQSFQKQNFNTVLKEMKHSESNQHIIRVNRLNKNFSGNENKLKSLKKMKKKNITNILDKDKNNTFLETERNKKLNIPSLIQNYSKNQNSKIKKFNKNNFSKNTINSLSFQNPKQQITNLVNSNSGKLTSATSLSSQNSSESIKNNYPLNEVDSNEMYYRLNTKETKNFYNKFNSQSLHKNIADRSNINENTVILILKIKVGKNDFRTFSLKKYDDLFISLEKFFDINKISQELIKPVIIKVFAALNKTFWLLNNKVEKKDQKYLYSLYKLYLKNKTNNNNNKCISKNKKGDKSSSISNDSSNEKNKMKLKKFN